MRLALLLTAALLVVAACGGGSDKASGQQSTESPEAALKRQFGFISKGQMGRHWDELHPAQQVFVTREKYIECKSKVNINIDKLEILEVYDEPIAVRNVPETTAKALTIKVDASSGLLRDTLTDTVHELLVDGRWRWILEPDDVAVFAKGECP